MNQGNGQRSFESKLPQGKQRFLAHVIEHGFDVKLRTPEDFIRHFPPAAVMDALAKQPELRANILELTVGVRRKIALKKSPESSGQDLQIALDENETDAETITKLFQGDDRIRYLDAKALWKYITESKFWLTAPSDAEAYGRAKQHMVFLLERALKDKLITAKDVVEGVTVPTLVEHLPKSELVSLLDEALAKGRSGKPFADDDLLETTACFTITEHVPFPVIWTGVIEKRLAVAHGLTDKPAVDEAPKKSSSKDKQAAGKGPAAAKEPATDKEPAAARESAQESSKSPPAAAAPAASAKPRQSGEESPLFDETEAHPDVDELEDVEFDELLESIQTDEDEQPPTMRAQGRGTGAN